MNVQNIQVTIRVILEAVTENEVIFQKSVEKSTGYATSLCQSSNDIQSLLGASHKQLTREKRLFLGGSSRTVLEPNHSVR